MSSPTAWGRVCIRSRPEHGGWVCPMRRPHESVPPKPCQVGRGNLEAVCRARRFQRYMRPASRQVPTPGLSNDPLAACSSDRSSSPTRSYAVGYEREQFLMRSCHLLVLGELCSHRYDTTDATRTRARKHGHAREIAGTRTEARRHQGNCRGLVYGPASGVRGIWFVTGEAARLTFCPVTGEAAPYVVLFVALCEKTGAFAFALFAEFVGFAVTTNAVSTTNYTNIREKCQMQRLTANRANLCESELGK